MASDFFGMPMSESSLDGIKVLQGFFPLLTAAVALWAVCIARQNLATMSTKNSRDTAFKILERWTSPELEVAKQHVLLKVQQLTEHQISEAAKIFFDENIRKVGGERMDEVTIQKLQGDSLAVAQMHFRMRPEEYQIKSHGDSELDLHYTRVAQVIAEMHQLYSQKLIDHRTTQSLIAVGIYDWIDITKRLKLTTILARIWAEKWVEPFPAMLYFDWQSQFIRPASLKYQRRLFRAIQKSLKQQMRRKAEA